MRFIFVILFLFISFSLFSQEKVEFRGVNRSGHYIATGLLKQWPENGPKLLLTIEKVGKGYSQPIVSENKIFITGIKEDTIDILSAYDMQGKMLWETPYGRSWTASYVDSRSTPTYENGRLYVSSGTGQVSCINAKTGNQIWQVDAIKKYHGEIYTHGDAESPALIPNAVLYTTGGEECTLVALDKNDGSLVWKAKSLGGAKSYASPLVIDHKGKKIILAQTAQNLIGIQPEDGKILWSYNLIQYHTHSQGKGAQANPPIYYNGDFFITSGYNHPGILFSLSDDENSIRVKWMNDTLDTHHGGVVLVDGNLYGSNWEHNAKGAWASVNWETGRTNWEQDWINKGSTIFADGMLYMMEEKSGNVALVEPSSEGMKIKSTFKVKGGTGPFWAHPAIYDGKMFIRHGETLLIYDI